MWSLASRPNEMLTIRFEDFEFTNNQAIINYYSNIKNQRKKFTIPDYLYNKVLNSKALKRNKESILRKQLQHQQERKLLDILYLT